MADLRFTLLPDGPSDRALLPILGWLLRELTIDCAIQAELADLRRLRDPPHGLAEKILKALELYPCELLFIHRDSEVADPSDRIREIEKALADAAIDQTNLMVVGVIPIRMQEAWLLFSELAIRKTAGNPNGRQALKLPALKKVETIADPKRLLHDLLREASGLKGRRLSRFQASRHAPQVSSFIEDFAPLRELPSFVALERVLKRVLEAHGWKC